MSVIEKAKNGENPDQKKQLQPIEEGHSSVSSSSSGDAKSTNLSKVENKLVKKISSGVFGHPVNKSKNGSGEELGEI